MKSEENEKSFAMAILNDYKKQTFRQFVVICILLGIILTFAFGVVYIITNFDIGYETITEKVSTSTGNACIGDSCGNGDISGESIPKND